MKKIMFLSCVLFVFVGLFCSCSKKDRDKILGTSMSSLDVEKAWQKWSDKHPEESASLVEENGVWYIVTEDGKKKRLFKDDL